MKKILILGTGNAQIDAIRFCKSEEFIVYGCSSTNNDKGISYLDHFSQIDIKDIDKIKQYAQEEKVDIVYSIGSDLAMPTVMGVSEALGLPHFISHETACICQQKQKLRSYLGKNFYGNLPYITAANYEELVDLKEFPYMMKPVDSQGQRGCFKVNNFVEIKNHFKDSLYYSTKKEVIIEKYINGPEVSVNAYVVDNEIKFTIISDRIVFDNLPGGIIKEHNLPSEYANENICKNIIFLVNSIVKKLNISNGPVYFQIKIQGETPFLIEVTPRLDGCHMWNLINYYCGINLLDATFKHLLYAQTPNLLNINPLYSKLRLQFICAKPNTIFDLHNYDLSASHYLYFYYKPGEKVKSLNGYMEKCGYLICE